MSDPTQPQPEPRALAPRKRVVAREVTAEVEAANVHAANLTPDVIQPERHEADFPADPVVVVDPTTLGHRHRRSAHQKVYRWTQCCTILSALLGVVGIVCLLGEDVLVARCLAAPAVVLGIVATVLSGRTHLSERWRGWAIAAAVFAAAVLALTWIQPAVTGEEHAPDKAPAPVKG
jgi:hypothetical protein